MPFIYYILLIALFSFFLFSPIKHKHIMRATFLFAIVIVPTATNHKQIAYALMMTVQVLVQVQAPPPVAEGL